MTFVKTVAVIGLGSIAAKHRSNIRLLFPQAKIIALSARQRMPTHHPENCDYLVESIDELLSYTLDFVIVASPAPTHVFFTQACLKLDIPVLIEKPVASDLHDQIKLINLIKYSTSIVAVGYCLRYLSSTLSVKKLVESGALGEIYNISVNVGQYLPTWRDGVDYRKSVSANKRLGGGVLLELSHEFDYLNWIFGPLHLSSAILRKSHEIETDVEDIADVVMTTSSGGVVNLHQDFIQKKPQRKVTIQAENAQVEWDVIQNEIVITQGESVQVITSNNEPNGNMYQLLLLDFYAAIKGETNQTIKVEETLPTLRLIDEIKNNYPLEKSIV